MLGNASTESDESTALLTACGVLPVVRARSASHLVEAVSALATSGVSAVELTMTTPGALPALETIRSRHATGLLVGMGSILSADDAARAVAAGAQFIVSPVRVDAVLERGRRLGVAVVPAALTPTELHECHRAGAPLIKLFPASVVGAGYVREVLAPMPHLSLMPSGGVTLGSIPDWRSAGARVVSLGGALLGDALEGGDLRELEERARTALRSWNESAQ